MSNLFNTMSDFILGKKEINECKKFNCSFEETAKSYCGTYSRKTKMEKNVRNLEIKLY